MSSESMPVTQQHLSYIARHTVTEDAFLLELKGAAVAAGIPEIWISHEQASFMQVLLRVANAREVIEVGTLAGYSAISMARALPHDGRLRTIEIEPARAAFAKEWIARSNVPASIEVLQGDAEEVLRELPAESADACFIDADKAGYPRYLDECMRILRPNGLVMVDNAFGFGRLFEPGDSSESVAAIRSFNDAMAARADVQAIIVPLGDGCWVGAKLVAPAGVN